MNSAPVVHIGYYKTGTTTLQTCLFGRHSQIVSIAKPNPTTEGLQILRHLTGWSNSSSVSARDLVTRTRKRLQDGERLVFSNESLADFRHYPPHAQISMADRICLVFGQAKILITIRNQIDLIQSLYIHLAKRGSYQPLDLWLIEHRQREVENLNFHQIAHSYAERFGIASIGVFPLEELAHEPDKYMQRLSRFLEVDFDELRSLLAGNVENRRRSARALVYAAVRARLPLPPLARFMPKALRTRFDRFLAAGPPAKIELPSEWREALNSQFAESNARLAREFDLDLASLGYAL